MSRVVKLEIDAKVTGLINGLKTASQATKDSAREFDSWSKTHQDSLDTVGKGMTTFGVLAAGGATLAVTKFASFDKAMSSVQAATHESTTNMGLLRQAAIDAGADTAFSAEEAAQGIEELAKAGISTSDIMGGGLTGALDLAAAGALGVGEAAEISASALTQFKLSGDDIPHLADLLAAGAGKAQGSVSDLGAALNQSGLVASATGLSIEETTGTLAAFASAGLVGSDAGTSFKSMLQRLQNPSKQSAKVMEDLGINMYDANGEFAGMASLSGQLATALGNKSSAERDAAMATMFGADAVRAANVLYQQGAQGITDWTNKVNDAGYASQTASIMQNNLAGDIEKLGGAFDTVFIKSGGVGNDMLRGLVQTAESFVDVVGKIPAPVLGIGTVIGGIAGGAALLGGGLITVLPKIRDTRDAMNDLFPAGSRGANGLGKVKRGMADLAKGAAVAGGILTVGVAIGKLAEMSYTGNIIEGTGHIAVKLQDIIDKGPGAKTALDDIFKGRDGSGLTDGIKGIDDAIDTVFGDSAGEKFNRWGENLVGVLSPIEIKGSLKIAEDAFRGIDTELANLANGGNADGAAQAMDAVMQKLKDSGVSAEEAAYLFPQYADALNRIEAESGGAAAGTAGVTEALDGMGAEAEEVVASLDDILASLFELGVLTRDVRGAEREFESSIDSVTESIKTNGKSLDETTEKGRANASALDALAASGQGYTESLAQSGASEKELQSSMQGTYDSLITAAGQFGITGDKATALARELMGVPDGVDVQTWMDDNAKIMAEATANAIEALPGHTKVSVAVSEDGTVGQVQSRIDSVTGKTEYVFVTDDGTVTTVQAGIASIDGKDVPVYVGDDGTVYSTQGKINGIKGKDVTITAIPNTGAAKSALDSLASPRTSTLTVYERFVPGARSPDNGPKASQFGRANGGSVFGPGTETSDSIPAWLSTNEHVLSAREVRGLGGHSAVESLRAMARSGNAPAFATGGAVGRAESKVKSTKRTYDRIDGKKANRLRKLAAKDQWEAAKDELKAAKASSKAADKRSKDAKKRAEDAAKEERERQGRLSETRRDVGTSLRRGEISDAFTSGSGLGQVDKLMELSRNKDYGLSTRRRVAKDAAGLEKALASLTKRSEGLEKALDAAKSKADELRAVRDAVAGDLRGEFSLSGMLSETRQDLGSNPFNAKSISSKANKTARRIEIFAGRLNRLRKLGYGETIIQEIAALGTEDGILAAGALMNASKSERSNIIKAYDRLDTASGKAGQYVTESMYKGGLDAADGLVRGLESKTKNVEDAFYRLGKNAEKSFKRSLGIKSPSRVMFGAGVNVGEGAELGILSKVGAVESAAEKLMTPQAFTIPPSPEVSRHQVAQNTMLRVDSEMIANAVAGALASYQPVVNIDGRKFHGTMQEVNRQYGNRR